jgi:hypothetical protein
VNPYGLGAISPEAATEQIFPQSRVRGKPGHDQGARDAILASAQQGTFALQAGGRYQALPQLCKTGRGPGMAKPVIFSTAGGIAMKFVPEAFAAGPIVGAIVLAGAAIAEVFGAIFAHHAAAVKKEQSILCAAIPAAMDSLQVIDQAVSSGQATPQNGMDALDSVVTGFRQAVSPIIHGADPMSSGECNAACVWLSELRAIVLVKKSQYQDLAAAPAGAGPFGPVGSAISQAAATAGLPSWLLWAAGAYLLWELI